MLVSCDLPSQHINCYLSIRKMDNYIKLRKEFIRVSQCHIDTEALKQLKHFYSYDISNRLMDYINDFECFIGILEKRRILGYDQILPLKFISETFVKDPILDEMLERYDTCFRSCLPVSLYNYYADDNVLPDFESLSTQENLKGASSLTCHAPRFENGGTKISKSLGDSEDKLQGKILTGVSEQLGYYWKDVARLLDLREHEINAIDAKYHPNLKKKSYEALKFFMEKNASDKKCWKLKLCRALDTARRRDLKEMVEDILY
ncbi:fas-associated death domain protein [Orussus abietinus]|uniref:fas-associated death domain protein n=1 Tax=Orussus abietinus TaxID=222816 RepID=UPI000625445C|nr:fas-associated death domain protein [Orussus abietinus]